ncbi:hypothetical protein E4U17_005566 [Claviceps sp. LM77 group G4]|nr:hypothetical protein E4U17_005566 [Claviceps sp. LM77 group G4]KAG6075304.1 hypothetical protein E4U16_003486 [Claviceps sp. LM84 group G4]
MSSPRPEGKAKKKSRPEPKVGPWVSRMIGEFRKGNAKAAKFPHTTFRDETKKGTKMSVHIYPDGRITEANGQDPTFVAEPASVEELAGEPWITTGEPSGDVSRSGNDHVGAEQSSSKP